MGGAVEFSRSVACTYVGICSRRGGEEDGWKAKVLALVPMFGRRTDTAVSEFIELHGIKANTEF